VLEDRISTRKPNAFEYILLFMGVVAIGVGYFFVHNVMMDNGLFSWQASVCLLLWSIMIVLIILTAVNENSKEELKIIIKQQADEMKLLREDFRRKR
jgi:hypothetical protein